MKEITLKFREVAVDGLPEESMDCLVVKTYDDDNRWIAQLHYSKKYNAFNVHDFSENDGTRINVVSHWIPKSEIDIVFEEDAQNVQTMD